MKLSAILTFLFVVTFAATSVVSSSFAGGGGNGSFTTIATQEGTYSSDNVVVLDVQEVEIDPQQQFELNVAGHGLQAAETGETAGGGAHEDIEVVYMDDDELAKEDDIPVSYHNALVLNEVSGSQVVLKWHQEILLFNCNEDL